MHRAPSARRITGAAAAAAAASSSSPASVSPGASPVAETALRASVPPAAASVPPASALLHPLSTRPPATAQATEGLARASPDVLRLTSPSSSASAAAGTGVAAGLAPTSASLRPMLGLHGPASAQLGPRAAPRTPSMRSAAPPTLSLGSDGLYVAADEDGEFSPEAVRGRAGFCPRCSCAWTPERTTAALVLVYALVMTAERVGFKLAADSLRSFRYTFFELALIFTALGAWVSYTILRERSTPRWMVTSSVCWCTRPSAVPTGIIVRVALLDSLAFLLLAMSISFLPGTLLVILLQFHVPLTTLLALLSRPRQIRLARIHILGSVLIFLACVGSFVPVTLQPEDIPATGTAGGNNVPCRSHDHNHMWASVTTMLACMMQTLAAWYRESAIPARDTDAATLDSHASDALNRSTSMRERDASNSVPHTNPPSPRVVGHPKTTDVDADGRTQTTTASAAALRPTTKTGGGGGGGGGAQGPAAAAAAAAIPAGLQTVERRRAAPVPTLPGPSFVLRAPLPPPHPLEIHASVAMTQAVLGLFLIPVASLFRSPSSPWSLNEAFVQIGEAFECLVTGEADVEPASNSRPPSTTATPHPEPHLSALDPTRLVSPWSLSSPSLSPSTTPSVSSWQPVLGDDRPSVLAGEGFDALSSAVRDSADVMPSPLHRPHSIFPFGGGSGEDDGTDDLAYGALHPGGTLTEPHGDDLVAVCAASLAWLVCFALASVLAHVLLFLLVNRFASAAAAANAAMLANPILPNAPAGNSQSGRTAGTAGAAGAAATSANPRSPPPTGGSVSAVVQAAAARFEARRRSSQRRWWRCGCDWCAELGPRSAWLWTGPFQLQVAIALSVLCSWLLMLPVDVDKQEWIWSWVGVQQNTSDSVCWAPLSPLDIGALLLTLAGLLCVGVPATVTGVLPRTAGLPESGTPTASSDSAGSAMTTSVAVNAPPRVLSGAGGAGTMDSLASSGGKLGEDVEKQRLLRRRRRQRRRHGRRRAHVVHGTTFVLRTRLPRPIAMESKFLDDPGGEHEEDAIAAAMLNDPRFDHDDPMDFLEEEELYDAELSTEGKKRMAAAEAAEAAADEADDP